MAPYMDGHVGGVKRQVACAAPLERGTAYALRLDEHTPMP
jgi:hypothetical protein